MRLKHFVFIFSIFLTIFESVFVDGDVFTAMVDLENLLVSEAVTTSSIIDKYIKTEAERLQRLKRF